jgi:hypothetical protein
MKALQHDPAGRQVFKVNFDQQNASLVVVSCRDFERYIGPCQNKANGWGVIVPLGSNFERQVRASGRVFVERTVEQQIEFRFSAGQECFGHRVPTQDPRLMHFDQAHEDLENPSTSSITPVMRRNARPWNRRDFMEKFHGELLKRDELLRQEGLA